MLCILAFSWYFRTTYAIHTMAAVKYATTVDFLNLCVQIRIVRAWQPCHRIPWCISNGALDRTTTPPRQRMKEKSIRSNTYSFVEIIPLLFLHAVVFIFVLFYFHIRHFMPIYFLDTINRFFCCVPLFEGCFNRFTFVVFPSWGYTKYYRPFATGGWTTFELNDFIWIAATVSTNHYFIILDARCVAVSWQKFLWR